MFDYVSANICMWVYNTWLVFNSLSVPHHVSQLTLLKRVVPFPLSGVGGRSIRFRWFHTGAEGLENQVFFQVIFNYECFWSGRSKTAYLSIYFNFNFS